jgi:hypothetical protein
VTRNLLVGWGVFVEAESRTVAATKGKRFASKYLQAHFYEE